MVCPSIDRLIKRSDPPTPKLAWCTAAQSRGSNGSCEHTLTDAPHHFTHLLDEDAAEVLEAEVVGPGAVRPQVEVLGQLVAPLSMDGLRGDGLWDGDGCVAPLWTVGYLVVGGGDGEDEGKGGSGLSRRGGGGTGLNDNDNNNSTQHTASQPVSPSLPTLP